MTLVWKSGLNLQSPASNDPLLDLNTQPSLDLQFATGKTLDDRVSGFPLVNHQRDASSGKSAGTYVGSDGLIKTSVVNLLTYSEQFDQSAWVKQENSGTLPQVTPNLAASPDGSVTADRILCSKSGNTYSFVQQSSAYSGNETGSIYLKSNTNSNQTVYFRVGVTVSYVTVSTEWQRFSINSTYSGSANFTIGARDSSDDVIDILAWGAQLEEGTTATTYIPTTSTISGAPRFDHDPVTGESLGLLIEEARTNDAFYSNDFTQWVTTATGGVNPAPVLVPASGVSPSGLTDATEITYPAVSVANSYSIIYLRPGTSGNTQYVFSAYLKGTVGGETIYLMSTANGINWASQSFTLTTDWERCVFPHTTLGTNSYFQIGVDLRDGAQSGQPAQVISVWGAQVEEGSFPTSYIPTSGTTVTRAADVASIEGTNFSSWFTQNTGTVFVEASLQSPAASGQSPIVSIDNSGADFRAIARRAGAGVRNTSNADLIDVTGAIWDGEKKKIAATWVPNDCALVDDGVLVGTDTSTNSPLTTVNQMQIGHVSSGGFLARMGGHMSRLTYYPYRLADATLQEITS